MMNNLLFNFDSIKKGYLLYLESVDDFNNEYEEYDYILANEYNFIKEYKKGNVDLNILNYFFNY